MSTTTKIIRYHAEIKGSPKVISEMRKMRDTNTGLGKANAYVTKTTKLNDKQIMITTARYDKFGKKLNFVKSEVHNHSKSLQKSAGVMSQYQKALMRVAIVVPVWMAMRVIMQAVFGSIRSGITAYKEFEKEMGRVATVTLATGATLKEFNALKKAGIQYAQRSTATLKETATAMYQLATAGISASDTIQGFSSVLDLAIGTMNSVEQTGKLMAGAFKLFGNELSYAGTTADKFKVIADTLAYTFKTQQVELQEISNAFGYVANAANAVDFDFKSLVGTIGFLNTGMLKGSKAGTSLMNALVRMGSKLGNLEKLTGRAFDPKKPIDFVEVMNALHDKIGEGKVDWETYGELMSTFGRRGARAVLSILQRYDDWDKSIHRSSASMRNAAEEMRIVLEDNLPKQLEKLGSKWNAEWAKLGSVIEKAILPALKKVNESLEQFDKNEMAENIRHNLQQAGTDVAGSIKEQIELIKMLKKLDVSDLEKLVDKTSSLDSNISKHNSTMLTMVDIYSKAKIKMQDAAEKGEDFGKVLASVTAKIDGTNPSGKLLLALLHDLSTALKKATEDENKFADAGILTREKFKELQDVKKASGVSSISLIQEELNYLKEVQKVTGKTQEIKKLEHKLIIAQTKELEKQRKIVNDIVKSSLREAFDTDRDFFAQFEDNFKESLRSAILDTASEGMTNMLFNLTGLDTILGKGLDTMNIDRAFDDGGLKITTALDDGFTRGANKIKLALASNATQGMVGAQQGYGIITDTIMGHQKQIPIAPADYYKSKAATGEDVSGGGDFWGNTMKLAGYGMMAASLFGGSSGRKSSGQRYSTAPGARTASATTRSTVKAVVTNITVAPVFNLPEGLGLEGENLVKAVEGKITPLIKDITARILEDESIASGQM